MSRLPDHDLLRFLSDDCPFSDITTEGLGITEAPAQLTFVARHDMTVCGIEEAVRLFELSGARAHHLAVSGSPASAGTQLLVAKGSGGALHRTYKVAQTLVEILSGIATAARAIVTAAHAENPRCRVACTRKHMPGMKQHALRAIEAGGAVPHRLGLSDYLLVFEEHRSLLDENISLNDYFSLLKESAPERKLAAEATVLSEVIAFAKAGVDIVQVDKMTPEQVDEAKQALSAIAPGILLAAAGGINPGNAGAYAKAGADILVTSSPYYAQPRDVKVTISKA
jgi:molybdenum transport protein